MPGHNIITIGASAGGIDILKQIVADLSADIPAAIFVVQHTPATGPGLLPEILCQAGPLAAVHARDGELIRHGQIYVAPPDHHMLVEDGHIHVVRGPKENGFRPAIDATFRTAARAYGPRVIGVVLSGMLDDGTAGLLAIKRRGGMALVQEPAEAAFPQMPINAVRYVAVDAVLSAADMPAMLEHFAREPVQNEQTGAAIMGNIDREIDRETRVSETSAGAAQHAADTSETVPFTCPDCGGVLAEYYDGDLLRFRCQVGHMYSPDSLAAHKTDQLDYQMWASYRALNERVVLARRLAEEARRLNDSAGERRFLRSCTQAEQQKEQLRQLLL